MFLLIYAVKKVTQYYKLFERTSVVVFHTSTVNVGAALAAAAVAVAVVAADVAGDTAATAACACSSSSQRWHVYTFASTSQTSKTYKKGSTYITEAVRILATCMLGHTFTDVCTFVVI